MKKEILAQVLSYEFCEITKNNFFTEHLWTTASKSCIIDIWQEPKIHLCVLLYQLRKN